MHEVETMFYVRDVPWHGLGVRVEKAPDSETALHLAGLDWSVKQVPIVVDEKVIDEYVANVRATDGKVLGVVSQRYKVIQNREAFMFTDEIVGSNGEYDTAGSLRGGKRVFICMKLNGSLRILGDEFTTYLVFSNGHDGTFGVHVNITPVRVVCMNTLNFAIAGAKRSFSVNHLGSVMDKVSDAAKTLGLTDAYMETLKKEAETLAAIKLSVSDIKKIVESVTINKNQQETLYTMLNSDDLANFKNTGWGVINAVSDFISHRPAQRNTKTIRERRMFQAVYSPTLLDQVKRAVVEIGGAR